MDKLRSFDGVTIASYLFMAMGLFVCLEVGLLAGLLAGLLVHETALLVAPWLRNRIGWTQEMGKALTLACIVALISIGITAAVIAASSLFSNGSEGFVALLNKMVQVLETGRSYLPSWAADYLPANTDELRHQATKFLQQNVWELQRFGQDVGRILVYILFGIIIGGLVLFRHVNVKPEGPLVIAMRERVGRLALSFRRVVFAQVRISLLNTTLTAIFIGVLEPFFGIQLPLMKTMIAVTFIVGLMPVIGNVISNTVIFVVSLGVSAGAAIAALVFLVAIHKLEYFVNARIVGGQINSRAWEMLTVMLVMEAVFGVPGLVAAPIFYAYVKEELKAQGLV
jgi:predicted PurR-regulated permease PerM